MILSNLWGQMNYKLGVPYVVSTYMREYDLSKANISALYTKNVINKRYYDYLYRIDKKSREVLIGLMIQEDSTVYDKIQEGIIEAKKMLFDANSIKEEEVLSIRNDSVSVFSRPLKETEFGLYKFSLKGEYTTYFKLDDIEFFYYKNPINKIEDVEIKGLNDNSIGYHVDGMVGLMCDIASSLQSNKIEETVKYLSSIYEEYINRELPIDFYRELNSESQFRFHTKNFEYMIDNINSDQLNHIDINRNLLILRSLIQIVSSIYTDRFNR